MTPAGIDRREPTTHAINFYSKRNVSAVKFRKKNLLYALNCLEFTFPDRGSLDAY